jgi:ABC-type sugar transport system permease subunit
VWIGTQNYAQIFHDSVFWHVLFRTLVLHRWPRSRSRWPSER